MGLREKQLVRLIQEETLPQLNAEMKEITGGGDYEWAVNWKSFENSEEALLNFEYQCGHRILDAIRSICYNDFGKQAVREGLKKIEIVNFNDVTKRAYHFADGVLHLDVAMGEKQSEGYPDDGEVKRVIEDGL